MAIRLLDLRQQPEKCSFNNTPDDEIRYAEAFWQSVKLQPTLESRLVSSDIKQRLIKKSARSKSCTCENKDGSEADKKLQELFVRARKLEEIERFARLSKLAEVRIQDQKMLQRRREERIKKEEISRDLIPKPVTYEDRTQQKALIKRKIGEAYAIEEMICEIDEFERRKLEEEERKRNQVDTLVAQETSSLGSAEIIVGLDPLKLGFSALEYSSEYSPEEEF